MSGAQYQVHVHGGDLYRPANDPRIVPLGPELNSTAKSQEWRGLYEQPMDGDTYIFNYPSEEKISTSGIRATITEKR